MRLRFTKMHGCGNDFVMIDGLTQHIKLTPEKVRFLADRHFGIGCDQVLVVEPPENPHMDFRYRIFNQDGSEVEHCGNGARCFAKYVRDRRLTGKNDIRVETAKGEMTLHVNNAGEISVDMGEPELRPQQIPTTFSDEAATYSITVEGHQYAIGAVSMGNPHAVITVDSVDTAPVTTLGPLVQALTEFPQGVNVGFMQVLSRNEIKLRVFERGVGETLACGTGACAAVVSGILQDKLDQKVTVHLTGGTISIEWQGKGTSVIQTGPATTVFQGQITL